MGPLGGADLRFRSLLPDTAYTARPRKGAIYSAWRGIAVYFPSEARTDFTDPGEIEGGVDLGLQLAGYIPRWFTRRKRSPI